MIILDSVIAYVKSFHSGNCNNGPTRDWLAMITLSAIILAGIIVWNAWAFSTVASGGVIGSSATSTPPVFSQSSIDAIHTVFANRAAEEVKYETGTYYFEDPSQ